MVPDQASVVPSSVVASVSTFADAQQTVDYLRSYGMDSRSLEVVGAELRLSRRQAAVPVVRRTLLSAGAGALLGVLSGVFVTLVAETTLTAFSVLLWGFVYGVLVGAMWGLFQGLVRNRPDAPPIEVITPTYYEVRCAQDDVSVALTLLATDPEPEPAPEPQPFAEPDRVIAAEPFTKLNPFVEPARLSEPNPFLQPEHFAEPNPFVEPARSNDPEPQHEPEPQPVAKSRYLVEPPTRVTAPEPEPEPVAQSKPAVEEPKPDAPKPPVDESQSDEAEPVVDEREPEPAVDEKPVVDDKPQVRRQPAQTSRKARAKKKTARTNAA
ncbi:hypothetical protein GCM10009745_44750 [Kribbella yunnanensis]|uniref:General stress protein 17M-like domain-containing protein n=1 Tax=Kribbella yunnanensis TaxID=190194 RepID=A0ABP4TVA0_9ACTN